MPATSGQASIASEPLSCITCAAEIVAMMSVGISRISRKPREKARFGSASCSAVIHFGTEASPRPSQMRIASTARSPETIQSAVLGPLASGLGFRSDGLDTTPDQIASPSDAASATPTIIASEFLATFSLVTRKIAVRIWGPITMTKTRGRI